MVKKMVVRITGTHLRFKLSSFQIKVQSGVSYEGELGCGM
jgi:hypothetical protein